jgi:hypothetical protein
MATAVLGCAMVVIPIGLIIGEGNDQIAEVLPWAFSMAIAAFAAVAATIIQNRRLARTLLFASAAMFTILGIVSILSIGIGFLATATVAVVAAGRLFVNPARM